MNWQKWQFSRGDGRLTCNLPPTRILYHRSCLDAVQRRMLITECWWWFHCSVIIIISPPGRISQRCCAVTSERSSRRPLPIPPPGRGDPRTRPAGAGAGRRRRVGAGRVLCVGSGGSSSSSLCFVTSLLELPSHSELLSSLVPAVCLLRRSSEPPRARRAQELLEEDSEGGGKSRCEGDSEERNTPEQLQDEIPLCLLLAASLSCTDLQR